MKTDVFQSSSNYLAQTRVVVEVPTAKMHTENSSPAIAPALQGQSALDSVQNYIHYKKIKLHKERRS